MSKNNKVKAENNAPEYADDVFEGTGIVPKEFNDKLVQLELSFIEKKPKTFNEEVEIVEDLFTGKKEIAMLAILMNRNFSIAMTRLQHAEVNLMQANQLVEQILSSAKPANVTKGGIILPGR